MTGFKQFNVTYDVHADVLYISTRRARSARGIEDSYGVVWRYDGEGELIGATIVDFNEYWHDKHELLSRELSKRFDIPRKQAETVLDHVVRDK
jgi:uncharacterized protein YuzE